MKYFGRDPVSGGVRLSRKVLTTGAATVVKQVWSLTQLGLGLLLLTNVLTLSFRGNDTVLDTLRVRKLELR